MADPLEGAPPDTRHVIGELYKHIDRLVPMAERQQPDADDRLRAATLAFMAERQPALTLGKLAADVHALHLEKGFYVEDRTAAHLMGLVMSELAEVIEHDRKFTNAAPSEKIPEFTNEEEEVADAILRLLDFAGRRKLRVGSAVLAKHAYNATRPPLHNKRY